MEPVLVGMEACASAHFIARTLVELGHDARLMPAQFVRVKPFTRVTPDEIEETFYCKRIIDWINIRDAFYE